jgi:hypothetical protein
MKVTFENKGERSMNLQKETIDSNQDEMMD